MFKTRSFLLILAYTASFTNFTIITYANSEDLENIYSQELEEKKLPKTTSQIINSLVAKNAKESGDVTEVVLNQGYIKSKDTKNLESDPLKTEDNKVDSVRDSTAFEFNLSLNEETNQTSPVDKLVSDASIAYQIGHIEVATSLYQKILSKSPNNIDALFGLATIYYLNKQISEARSLFTQLLTLDPNHQTALNNFLALAGEEAPIEAIKQLKRLEAINPDVSLIPAQIAIIYTNIKDYSKAVKYFNKAIIISPENLMYRYNLAVILDNMGEREKSIEFYKQILRQDYQQTYFNFDYRSVIEKRLRYLNSLSM
ncbi:MAG: tetratricopeptide repeat protein [Alphaproteobacteria bacterium]